MDEPTKVYYQTTTADQRVYYSATLYDVNSGRELYNQDFQMVATVSSKEEIVDVDWTTSIVKQAYEKTYPVISGNEQKPPSVSAYEINKELLKKLDYNAMAQSYTTLVNVYVPYIGRKNSTFFQLYYVDSRCQYYFLCIRIKRFLILNSSSRTLL